MKLSKEEWAKAVRVEFEALAIKDAEAAGFDYTKEPHGLFRVYMSAMAKNDGELLKEAARRVQANMEKENAQEDPR